MSRGTEFVKAIFKKVTSEGFARCLKNVSITTIRYYLIAIPNI